MFSYNIHSPTWCFDAASFKLLFYLTSSGLAADRAHGKVEKAAKNMDIRLQNERIKKGMAMRAQAALYKEGVGEATVDGMLTPAKKYTPGL